MQKLFLNFTEKNTYLTFCHTPTGQLYNMSCAFHQRWALNGMCQKQIPSACS